MAEQHKFCIGFNQRLVQVRGGLTQPRRTIQISAGEIIDLDQYGRQTCLERGVAAGHRVGNTARSVAWATLNSSAELRKRSSKASSVASAWRSSI